MESANVAVKALAMLPLLYQFTKVGKHTGYPFWRSGICESCADRVQLELSEPDKNATLPNIFGHCEVKRLKRQYDTGCIGICEGCFEDKTLAER